MELKPAIVLFVLLVPVFWFLPLIVALFRAHARRRLVLSLNLVLATVQVLVGFGTSNGDPVAEAGILYGILIAAWLGLLIWATIGESTEKIRAAWTMVSLCVMLCFGILGAFYF